MCFNKNIKKGESTMTKGDLVIAISEGIGCSKKEAERTVELIFEEMKSSLSRGEEVKISGFGVFQVKFRKERTGRSPIGGHEKIVIPATKTIGFKPSKNLKSCVK